MNFTGTGMTGVIDTPVVVTEQLCVAPVNWSMGASASFSANASKKVRYEQDPSLWSDRSLRWPRLARTRTSQCRCQGIIRRSEDSPLVRRTYASNCDLLPGGNTPIGTAILRAKLSFISVPSLGTCALSHFPSAE
jgi:hypothetical protein